MNKKGRVIWISAVLSTIILTIFLVNAQGQSPESSFNKETQSILKGVVEFFNVILSPILGDSSYTTGTADSSILLMKVFMFLVLLAVLWVVLESMPIFEEYTWAVALISIAGSILVVRYALTPGWIETIFLPWSALGIAIASFMPLLIYYFFVFKITMPQAGAAPGWRARDHPTIRKLAWLFAAVAFIIIYFTRADDIGKIAGAESFNPANIYWVAALVSVAFLAIDGTIRRKWIEAQVSASGAGHRNTLIMELQGRIAAAHEQLNQGMITPAAHGKIVRDLQKRIAHLMKY